MTVWSQRQMVTSYMPVFTICPLGGAASSMTAPTAAATAVAQSPSDPFPIPAEGNVFPRDEAEDECSTSYSSTLTPICATTISPLAAPAIKIDKCDQGVTFSSEVGYSLSFPTASTTSTVGSVGGGGVNATVGDRIRVGGSGNGNGTSVVCWKEREEGDVG